MSMVAYQRLAEFYDKMMADVPYEHWTEYLQRIWRALGIEPKTILDLACGTGNTAVLLKEKKYDVTGTDLSPHMLKMAKRKNRTLPFIHADMRTLSLGKRFDAVICLYDSLNYLLKESEVQDAFRNVHKHLEPGGAFVFDVHTLHMIRDIWGRNNDCFEVDGMHVCWRNRLDPHTDINTIRLDCFIQKGRLHERFFEVHQERGYPLEFLHASLEKAGFCVKGCWDAFTFNPPHERSERVYFAAVKH